MFSELNDRPSAFDLCRARLCAVNLFTNLVCWVNWMSLVNLCRVYVLCTCTIRPYPVSEMFCMLLVFTAVIICLFCRFLCKTPVTSSHSRHGSCVNFSVGPCAFLLCVQIIHYHELGLLLPLQWGWLLRSISYACQEQGRRYEPNQ